jgi:hypothetical protein
VTGRSFQYVGFALIFAALVVALSFVYLPEKYFRPFDVIGARQYMAIITFLQLAIIILLTWWVFSLPAPAEWYLTCCRTCLSIFSASSLAICGSLLPERTLISIGNVFNMDLKFSSPSVELLFVAILSVVFLDRFSRRYAYYRT